MSILFPHLGRKIRAYGTQGGKDASKGATTGISSDKLGHKPPHLHARRTNTMNSPSDFLMVSMAQVADDKNLRSGETQRTQEKSSASRFWE
jgi:hypothetical protein